MKLKKTFSRMTVGRGVLSGDSGLTMIELLIVLAIVGVLAILFFFGTQGQIEKGRDAKRKDDLEKIKIAYESYYSDNDCYPPSGTLSSCNGTTLQPYLSVIPCDPFTDQPYTYLPLSDACSGYRILTELEYEDDPSTLKVGCLSTTCGFNSPYTEANYGVAVGTQVPEDGFDNGGISGGEEERNYVIGAGGASCIDYVQEQHQNNCPIFFSTSPACNSALSYCISLGSNNYCSYNDSINGGSGNFVCTN